MEQGIQRIDYRLLQGCCLEAERADIISVSLEGLRMALPEAYGGTITSLVDEIRRSARKLRDLADRSQMHFTRVPILLNYLDVILPCYSKTLRDITEFYEDRTVSKDMRWRRMYHKMTQELRQQLNSGLSSDQRLCSDQHLRIRQILDDGFKHSLIVYRDLVTQGLRLQASVWDGELKNCPVWTAFVTHQSASPTWLVRKSDHRIWLKDVQLYVFCQQYHQQNQRKGTSAGVFEIDFVSEMGASRFIEELQPQTDPSEASTDTMEAIEDSK
ncbi:uncharacterized protein N0V96_004127 [Colletotrichum fioriniae]|uniref:uncharacterized protein n=1 Tax=Colletotrichum fioriniae TaxID=710243 RepID=UPI0032DB4386|nr:hypothetical protein N0V96_004127 [Colletotrichum fioriniae]